MKKLMTLALALIVLNACNKEIPQEDLDIKLSGTAISTKGQGSSFPNSGADIKVFAAKSASSSEALTDFSSATMVIDHQKAISADATGGSTGFTFTWDGTAPQWPVDGSYLTFRAYSPDNLSLSSGAVTATITGSGGTAPADILFSKYSSGTTLIHANKTTGTVNFDFKHILSQLSVIVTKNSAAPDVTIDKLTITVAAASTVGTYNFLAATNSWAVDDGTTAAVFTYEKPETGNTSWTLTTGNPGNLSKTVAENILLLPTTQAGITVALYADGNETALTSFTLNTAKNTSSNALTLQEGKRAVVTITINGSAVGITGSVTDWVDDAYGVSI